MNNKLRKTKKILLTLLCLLILLPVGYFFAVLFIYREFGQEIAIYKNKDCVNLRDPSWDLDQKCMIFASAVSINILAPITLDKGLEIVLKQKSSILSNINLYNCSVDGNVIIDTSKEFIYAGKLYKCWPN